MLKYHGKDQLVQKITLWHAYQKSKFLYGSSVIFPFLSKTRKVKLQRFYTTTLKSAIGIPPQSHNLSTYCLTNQVPLNVKLFFKLVVNMRKINLRFPKSRLNLNNLIDLNHLKKFNLEEYSEDLEGVLEMSTKEFYKRKQKVEH